MAKTKISLYHPDRQKFCLAPVGFSWTTLIFGPFPLALRRPCAWMLMFAVGLIGPATFLVSDLVFAFCVNRLYIRSLIKKGYRVRGVAVEKLDEVARSLGYSREKLEAVFDWGNGGPPAADSTRGEFPGVDDSASTETDRTRAVQVAESETEDRKQTRRTSTGRRIRKVVLWGLGAAVGLIVALVVLGWLVGKSPSDEEARNRDRTLESPAPSEPLTAAREASGEWATPGSETDELSPIQQLARTAGFHLGQRETLNRIRETYPDLETDVTKAEKAFAASFGRAVQAIEAELGDGLREAVLKELKRRSLQVEVPTKEEGTAFIAKVEARARGEIESPFLETLLAYQYKDAPHEELANGFGQKFTSQQHPKAKGLEIELVLPRSWTRREGRGPNVVQFFQARPVQGTGSVVLIVYDTVAYQEAQSGEPMSAEAIRELEASAGSRAMMAELLEEASLPSDEETTVIEVQESTLDGLPAVMARETWTTGHTGETNPMYAHVYMIPYSRYLIFLQLRLGKAPGLDEAEFQELQGRWRPLFQLIADSLVVQNRRR